APAEAAGRIRCCQELRCVSRPGRRLVSKATDARWMSGHILTREVVMEAGNDAKRLFEAERSVYHAERPGFRIAELQISRTQTVPWHYHTSVHDTFFVLQGCLRLFLRDPKDEIRLAPGETYTVRPRRPHLVTNAGEDSAVFLVLQLHASGEYDFVPLG